MSDRQHFPGAQSVKRRCSSLPGPSRIPKPSKLMFDETENETTYESTPSAPTQPSGSPEYCSPPPKSNLLCELPKELVLGIVAYLDCVNQNSLLLTCRDLHALLMPGLKKVSDKYGNDRYLYKLLKTGNLAEIEAWPGTPTSTLFTLQGDMLARYQATARREVRNRMHHLNSPPGLYPCLRLAKSGLMVALDHEQWKTAAFLLGRDGGQVGFLGTKEHFWAARVYRDLGESLLVEYPDPEKKPVSAIVSTKPPLWEQFTTHWLGQLLDGGEEADIDSLLEFIEDKLDEQTKEREIIEMEID
ncbi:hypothetical protein PG984_011734 [Apiospora sp. TS-2023a]